MEDVLLASDGGDFHFQCMKMIDWWTHLSKYFKTLLLEV